MKRRVLCRLGFHPLMVTVAQQWHQGYRVRSYLECLTCGRGRWVR